MVHLIGLVGNNAKKSTNRSLIQFMKKHFEDQADIEILEVAGLPLFNKPRSGQIPQQAQEMADKIEQADGVIIATPEYDLSVPSALSNALAWLSYNVYPFVDKPVMIVGASYGTLGSARAQQHLRSILNAPVLRAVVMPGNEFLLGHSLQAFNDEGELIMPDKLKQLEGYFADFIRFIGISEVLRESHDANVQIAADFYSEQLRYIEGE